MKKYHLAILFIMGLIFTPHAFAKSPKPSLSGIKPAFNLQKAPKTKMGPRLYQALYPKKTIQGDNSKIKISNSLKKNADGKIFVVIKTNDEFKTSSLLELTQLGFKKTSQRKNKIRGWVDPDAINKIEDLSWVVSVDLPPLLITRKGDFLAEAYTLLHVEDLYEATGATGAGVRIGVISNGAGGIFDSVASLDIPSGSDTSCDPDNVKTSGVHCKTAGTDPIDTGSEGTAMMEIIHDIAPNAELYFVGLGTEGFLEDAFDYLSSSEEDGGADCNIIVDDVGVLNEPFFEDGDVALSASEAIDRGSILFSSAGNGAVGHVQEVFVDSVADDYSLHDFETGNNFYQVLIAPQSDTVFVLQWNDSFTSATNDLDFYADYYSLSGTYLTSTSSAFYNIGDAPFEGMVITNSSTEAVYAYLYVSGYSLTGSPVTFEIVINQALDAEYSTGDSIIGHPALQNMITVGAISADDENLDEIESYSSIGPATVNGETRNKPDFISLDGLSVTGNGDFPIPFFGTSASAPTLAACAVLLLEIDPTLTRDTLYKALKAGATDLGDPGFDFTYGNGLVDCQESSESLLDSEGGTTTGDDSTTGDDGSTSGGSGEDESSTGGGTTSGTDSGSPSGGTTTDSEASSSLASGGSGGCSFRAF